MPNATPNAVLDEFERGLMRSKKCLKRVLRRIEGSKARATFVGLKSERREAMMVAGAAIDRQIAALRKEMKSALNLDDKDRA